MTSAFGVFVSTCAWLMAINIFSSRYFLWAQNPSCAAVLLCLAFSGLPVMMVMHEKKVESTKGWTAWDSFLMKSSSWRENDSPITSMPFSGIWRWLRRNCSRNPFPSVEWAANLLSVFPRRPSHQQFNILKCRKEKISTIFQKKTPTRWNHTCLHNRKECLKSSRCVILARWNAIRLGVHDWKISAWTRNQPTHTHTKRVRTKCRPKIELRRLHSSDSKLRTH